jgi:hypothetical protein
MAETPIETKSQVNSDGSAKIAKKPPSDKSYLQKYIAQSIMTPAQRAAKEEAEVKNPPVDPNPFSVRAFVHQNVTQTIPSQGQPKAEKKKEEEPKTEVTDQPAAEVEKKPGFFTRIKNAFGSGKSQTEPKPSESEEGKNEEKAQDDGKKLLKAEEPAETAKPIEAKKLVEAERSDEAEKPVELAA